MKERSARFRRIVLIVAFANLAYFAVEFAVAWRIQSVSLYADSLDFLEDALVNFLIVAVLSWSDRSRAIVGKLLAVILLAPAIGALITIGYKWSNPVPPQAALLTVTGAGALAVNFSCAMLLVRHREQHGSLAKAAFLSARNDVLANIAIIAAGALTAFWPSIWPDLVVGMGIAFMNADAAHEVYVAASKEHRPAP